MMKLLGVIALVAVVIAATVVITKHSDDILAAFTSWTDSSAQVPGVVPFQGVLSDSTGDLAADGDYTVTFAFYSAAAGGAPLRTSAPSNSCTRHPPAGHSSARCSSPSLMRRVAVGRVESLQFLKRS